MEHEIITHKDLVDKFKKLTSTEYKSWNNLVETVYIDYLIGFIEGSTDDYDNATIDKESYKKSFQFFKRDIDDSLEETIDLLEMNLDNDKDLLV